MSWFKKHAEACSIIGSVVISVAGSVLWITSQFSDMNIKMNHRFSSVDQRFTSVDAQFSSIEKDIAIIKAAQVRFADLESRFCIVEKDIAIIKTVMIMNHHMPSEFAQHKEDK